MSESGRTHSSVKATTGYAFLNTESIVLPTKSDTSTSTYLSSSSVSTTTTLVTTNVTTTGTAAPPAWPEIVVPSNAKTAPPSNTTLIAVLFQRSLSWYWVVTQRATTAQIFTFMPKILSTALGVDESQVSTSRLMMYETATDDSVVRTLYLCYVPTNYTEALKQLIQNPQSLFYRQNQSSIEQELVSLIDPTFDPLAYANTSDGGTSGALAPQTRNVLVGSISGAAGAVLLGVLAWWVRKRHADRVVMEGKSKRNTIQSFVDCSAPQQETSAQPTHMSYSYFAGDNDATPSVTAFESPCGVTGTIGMREPAIHPLPWSPVPVMRTSHALSSVQLDPSARWSHHPPEAHDAAQSHEQLVPYETYLDGFDKTVWDGHSFALEEQGEAQQRKNDVLECRVVV